GRACANNSTGYTRPGQNPGNCHRANGRVMPPGDWLQRVTQREVALQIWRFEFRSSTSPVVCGERVDAGGTEGVCQDARLHRAVANDARPVRRTPRKLHPGNFAFDHREGRLKRVDVTSGFTAFEKLDAEVRNADGANLSLFDELLHGVPRVFNRHSAFVR